MSKKIVLKVELNCEKCKQTVMKTVAGVEEAFKSVDIDTKKKITVIGYTDQVCLAAKLRKLGSAELVRVGPANESKKQQPEQKEDPPNKKEKNDKKET